MLTDLSAHIQKKRDKTWLKQLWFNPQTMEKHAWVQYLPHLMISFKVKPKFEEAYFSLTKYYILLNLE